MSQISIPCVAFYPTDPVVKKLDVAALKDAIRLPPELYIDEDHHGAIYCPDCGVMCSRMPRKQPKRKDGVDAFYSHIKGFEGISCPHRKSGGGGNGDGPGREKKAINLVSFAGWKGFQDEDEEDDELDDQLKKPKEKVRGGLGANRGGGFDLVFDENGDLLKAGQFKTVRRLVYLAQHSLEINIQFPGVDATRLGDLIISVEKLQSNSARYIGKSYLIYGKPTSIKSGQARKFFNFQSPDHEVSAHCDPRIVEGRNWKNYELGHFYIFYGMVEGTPNHTIIKILEPGQIDRIPSTAYGLFRKLR